MKGNRKKLAVLVVVAGVALFAAGALASADDGPGKHALEGVWMTDLKILSVCGVGGVTVEEFPVLLTFTHDGKVIETPGTLALESLMVRRVSPGLGTWQHQGGRQYTTVFRFFRVSADLTSPEGFHKITEAIELDQDGDAFTTTGTGGVFDASGNLVPSLSGCFTQTGKRLE